MEVDGQTLPPLSTKKARALLTYLVMHRGLEVARERLLELFWPEADPELARGSLRTALWSIRRSLRAAAIPSQRFFVATKAVVCWRADTEFDVETFKALAKQDDETARHAALELYRGDFLEGDYDQWAIEEREAIALVYESLLSKAVATSRDVAAAQRLLARNPYEEETYVALIEAELAAGRRFSAATLAERCRAALAEIGASPSPTFNERFGDLPGPSGRPHVDWHIPFAGRESELAAIMSCVENAEDGRALMVHGEAGIGKSALLREAAARALDRGLRLLEARSAANDPRLFGPWEPLFVELTKKEIGEVAPGPRRSLNDEIARELVRALGRSGAIFIDDAHLLRGEALDVLKKFLSVTSTSGGAIVLASRPEGVASLRALSSGCDELPLRTLSCGDLTHAVEQAAGRPLHEVAAVVYERSNGHPYFFAALFDSLVEDGTLHREEQQWTASRFSPGKLSLPATVKVFIEGRLRSRGEEAATIACALALEPSASADDVIAVTGLREATVLDALDDLLALGLIVQPQTGFHFVFTHDLVREVAAILLNVGRRTRLHRAFAVRLESSTERDASLRCARHYAAARDHLAAAPHFRRAIQEAAEWLAYREMLARSLEATGPIEQLRPSPATNALVSGFKNQAAMACIFAGDFHHAVELTGESALLAEQFGDDAHLAAALARRAAGEFFEGSIDRSLEDASCAERAARRSGNEEALAFALVGVSRASRLTGREAEALRYADEAYEIALKLRLWHPAAVAAESLVLSQTTWWHFGEALQTQKRCAEAAQLASPYFSVKLQYCSAATYFLMERLDDCERAVFAAERLLADYSRTRKARIESGDSQLVLAEFDLLAMRAFNATAREDWSEALRIAELLVGFPPYQSSPRYRQRITFLRIEALLGRAAEGDAARAVALAEELRDFGTVWEIDAWSNCVALSRARVSARIGSPQAHSLLKDAYESVEANARRAPLDADRAFARLAASCREAQEQTLATIASVRADEYRERRLAAVRETLRAR